MLSALRTRDPALLSAWGAGGPSVAAFIAIVSFLAIGVGFIGVPQLMVRFMSARSEESLVPAMIISITVILLFDIGAVAGMLGGFLTTVIWVLALKPLTHGLLEIIPGFMVGLALTAGVSKLTAA